jgi:Lon protease-like protein
MPDRRDEPAVFSSVPLFPLPNVVLFPRAVLPLHIFEERYKTMTADALAGDRRIAMALLQPGWEKDYYGRPPIDPIVCIGSIVSHERLPDGKYNFLLQGRHRGRILGEIKPSGPCPDCYRLAELELLVEPPLMEIDLSNERLALTNLFSEDAYTAMPLGRQFLQMLSSPLATADILDLLSFNLLDDVQLKQRLLAEPDARRRARRVISALEAMRPVVELTSGRSHPGPSLN